jgi:hypothetical protein
MSIYTFYPCQPDGSSTTFQAIELAEDRSAAAHAAALLDQHPSCAYIAVWCGERKVLTYSRFDPGLQILAPSHEAASAEGAET